jgi:hypothetical protein
LLTKNPAHRLRGEQARMALSDFQHQHQVPAGCPGGDEEGRRWALDNESGREPA